MKRVYKQTLFGENEIADEINKWQEKVGAVITID